MAYSPNPNEDAVLTAVRAFLIQYVIPAHGEVITSNDDRVAPPKVPYIVMNPISKPRISTNLDSYETSIIGTATVATQTIVKPTKFAIQLDCVDKDGDATNWVDTLSAIWFSELGAQFFAPYGIAPLYNEDPKFAPWVNSENQWENRWIVNTYLQFNPALVIPTYTYPGAIVGVVDVETFPII